MTFEIDGFEVFHGVVSPDDIAVLRSAVDAGCVRFRGGEAAVVVRGVALSDYVREHPERNPGVRPEDVEGEPYILGNLAALDDSFRCFLAFEELWNLAAHLLGVSSEDVSYHYSQVLRKPALVGPALSWHRDYANTYISTDGPWFVRLLLPMQAMSEANGGTGVVPGSHRLSGDEALGRVGATKRGDDAVYPQLAAGDILALHSKTLHGGGVNRSEFDRELLAIQFGWRNATLLHTHAEEHLTLTTRSAFLDANSDMAAR